MGRKIDRISPIGLTFSELPGDVVATVPSGKTWILSRVSHQITAIGSATDFQIAVFESGGQQIYSIFLLGSTPAVQTEGVTHERAKGWIMGEDDEIRVIGTDNGVGTGVVVFVEFEEVDG